MQDRDKILVVGTTPDYVDWIRRSCPGQALFLTDPALRPASEWPAPPLEEELLCDLSDYELVQRALERFLRDEGIRLDGVACYDCESMELAAVLAARYGLSYPSPTAVRNCRNKYLSKTLWQEHDLSTPRVRLVRSEEEAAAFLKELEGACILKPLSGSGSELIFHCEDEKDCSRHFQEIRSGLKRRRTHRLYSPFRSDDSPILAEECIDGTEYSCDFVFDYGEVHIIRLTRKVISSQGPFGTAVGYVLEPWFPPEIDETAFHSMLRRSAEALALDRAFCMLDFKVDQGRTFLLELAPRPGGDCLPFLLRRARNLDILKLFLDFCRRRPLQWDRSNGHGPVIALRVHASKGGVLQRLNAGRLEGDTRVREIHLTRRRGHEIRMPPEDYDSWLLGHVIFEPDSSAEASWQCHDLLEKLVVEVQ